MRLLHSFPFICVKICSYKEICSKQLFSDLCLSVEMSCVKGTIMHSCLKKEVTFFEAKCSFHFYVNTYITHIQKSTQITVASTHIKKQNLTLEAFVSLFTYCPPPLKGYPVSCLLTLSINCSCLWAYFHGISCSMYSFFFFFFCIWLFLINVMLRGSPILLHKVIVHSFWYLVFYCIYLFYWWWIFGLFPDF